MGTSILNGPKQAGRVWSVELKGAEGPKAPEGLGFGG